MKRFLWLSLFTLTCAAWGQAAPSADSGRLFLPKNFAWGYTQFDVAPPHNEPDPNLCAANARDFGGVNAPCNAFVRYMLWGYVERSEEHTSELQSRVDLVSRLLLEK